MATVSPTGIYYRAAGEAQSTVEAQGLAVANSVNAAIGLVPIVPTSVSVGSGSGSAGATGLVTFTGASSVQLNGCFSSGYTNYKVIIRGNNSVATELRMRYVSGTTPDSSTNYFGTAWYANLGASFGHYTAYNSSTSGYFNAQSGGYLFTDDFTVLNPYDAAQWTLMTFDSIGLVTTAARISGMMLHSVAASYSGIQFFASAGTLTGTMQVYGIR